MSSSMASVVAKRYWRAADAAVVLAFLAASGQGVGSFCRQWRLDRQRVRSWQKRLPLKSRAGVPAEPLRFVGLVGGSPSGTGVATASASAPLAPPSGERASSGIEVVLPTGIRVRVAEGSAVPWATAFIRALTLC